ncbi:MAG: hypothetical protein HC897_06185 [Thermoanaerobaculia bacterium]|nr:hypothetical protein [Thermoanaerobaculia bacterium]
MLHHTHVWVWQAILLLVGLTVSGSATNRCSSPGWELRTTVRGLGGEPLREMSFEPIGGNPRAPQSWKRSRLKRASVPEAD